MSGKSQIQWTDTTWNPVTGCTRVSAGCDHCYAFQLHDQRHIAWKRGRWDSAPKQYHKPFSKVQLLGDRLDEPLHWRRPRRVFVNSMSDLFHPDVPDKFISDVFNTMYLARQHTFQVLTKRPERMRDFVKQWNRDNHWLSAQDSHFPLPNVWLGTSVEDQAAADERIPYLLETPAAIRFLSCEPLLGPVDLYNVAYWRNGLRVGTFDATEGGIDWVIIGGESGPHARPMESAWAEMLIEQCQESWVAVFVKQLGSSWAKTHGAYDKHGGDMAEWPEWLRIREYPAVIRSIA